MARTTGPNFRKMLDDLMAGTPKDFQVQVNEIVDDIEERKWNEGWDAGRQAYESGGAYG